MFNDHKTYDDPPCTRQSDTVRLTQYKCWKWLDVARGQFYKGWRAHSKASNTFVWGGTGRQTDLHHWTLNINFAVLQASVSCGHASKAM